ncbi:MAG TPA: hypothetical protein VFO55_02530 [Gemmatimonadaceae bacterium]|nr:hypothetical protein [Gemmatimonadaceae bacterium]
MKTPTVTRAWLMLAIGVGCQSPPPVEQAGDALAYFEAKTRYEREPRGRPSSVQALQDLEARARAIIGPVSIGGTTGVFNIESLHDEQATELDGLRFADTAARRAIIVTTPELLSGWLRQAGGTTTDPLLAVAHEDRLTWVFWDNAHVSPFADVRARATLPGEVFLAQLVGRSNDTATEADEIIVGVRRANRVYLIIAPAAVTLTAPASCGSPWTDVPYRKCFDTHAGTHPDFPKIVAQVRELASLTAGQAGQ